jgi:hypothetical protein
MIFVLWSDGKKEKSPEDIAIKGEIFGKSSSSPLVSPETEINSSSDNE